MKETQKRQRQRQSMCRKIGGEVGGKDFMRETLSMGSGDQKGQQTSFGSVVGDSPVDGQQQQQRQQPPPPRLQLWGRQQAAGLQQQQQSPQSQQQLENGKSFRPLPFQRMSQSDFRQPYRGTEQQTFGSRRENQPPPPPSSPYGNEESVMRGPDEAMGIGGSGTQYREGRGRYERSGSGSRFRSPPPPNSPFDSLLT